MVTKVLLTLAKTRLVLLSVALPPPIPGPVAASLLLLLLPVAAAAAAVENPASEGVKTEKSPPVAPGFEIPDLQGMETILPPQNRSEI